MMTVTDEIINNNDQRILNEGFTTTNANIEFNQADEIKYLFDSFERSYKYLTENINLNDFEEIDRMNHLSNLIAKLRIAYALYEYRHNINLANNNAFKDEETESMNDFYSIYNECMNVYKSNGKTL